jgi:hypothetical protein
VKAALAGALALAVLGASAPVGAQSAADMAGRHSMQGEITKVDSKKGWIHVKTGEGTMIVHMPPSELQTVKKGDAITLELALKTNGPAKK